jgi:hypothetical protein
MRAMTKPGEASYSMTRNPRHAKVSEVELAISKATIDIQDVTYGELMAAGANMLRHWAGQLIEVERYPERFPDLRQDHVDAIAAIDSDSEDADDD